MKKLLKKAEEMQQILTEMKFDDNEIEFKNALQSLQKNNDFLIKIMTVNKNNILLYP